MALKKAKAAPVKAKKVAEPAKPPAAAPAKTPAKPAPPAGVGLLGYIGDRLAYVGDYTAAPDTATVITEKGLTEVTLVPLANPAAVAAFRTEHGYGV